MIVNEEKKGKMKVLFPDDIETITISKNDYDRLYGDLTYQNIKLEHENAQLKDKIGKAIEYIEWQRDNPQYDNIWRNYECNELLKILKEN